MPSALCRRLCCAFVFHLLILLLFLTLRDANGRREGGGERFQTLSHSVQDSHSVGKVACLNSTLASLFLQVCVCVSKFGGEGWLRHCRLRCVHALHAPGVCVLFSLKPPWLNLSVGSCSGLYVRLVSTALSSSPLLPQSADTISSPLFSQPTFSHYILSHRFSFPTLPLSCLQGSRGFGNMTKAVQQVMRRSGKSRGVIQQEARAYHAL